MHFFHKSHYIYFDTGQVLTEMTSSISRRVKAAGVLGLICHLITSICRFSHFGSLNLLEPSGPVQGLPYFFFNNIDKGLNYHLLD